MRWKVLKQELKDLVGQVNLRNWISDVVKSKMVGHSYVFFGPLGLGKKTLATIFAKLYLCTNSKEFDTKEISIKKEKDFLETCGFCDSCRTFESGTNPDFYWLTRENKSIGVDDIRRLQENIHIAPMYSQRKVYIIPEGELMTDASQNALLKTLEEPPKNVLILILTTNIDKFLPTLLSRIVRKDMEKYSTIQIQKFLMHKFSNQQNAAFIARIADGNIGKALHLIEDENFLELREAVFDIILGLTDSNQLSNIDFLKFLEANKERIDEILDLFSNFLRDLFVIQQGNFEKILINSDKKDIMISKSRVYNQDKLLSLLQRIHKVKVGLLKNANFGLSMEYLAMEWNLL